MHNIHSGAIIAIRWQISDFLSDGYSHQIGSQIVMFALFLTVCEIFSKTIKCQKGVKRNLRHSTGNVRFNIVDFFSDFYLPGNIR